MNYRDLQKQAAERVAKELEKPDAVDRYEIGCEDTFDPWELFPCVYGVYSSEFDDMALEVLEALLHASEGRWDEATAMRRKESLAHEMFREMLCKAELCDYGTSPRVCFANHDTFAPLLPKLIEKWRTYYNVEWGD